MRKAAQDNFPSPLARWVRRFLKTPVAAAALVQMQREGGGPGRDMDMRECIMACIRFAAYWEASSSARHQVLTQLPCAAQPAGLMLQLAPRVARFIARTLQP